MRDIFTLARGVLFRMDPELAHMLGIRALQAGAWIGNCSNSSDDQRLRQTLWGLEFSNPLGMAAGFDKNAEAFEQLFAAGFGAAEVGTLTPKPQPGNPKPRLFRLTEDEAIINRMGFNNQGHSKARERILLRRKNSGGILGINIGANKQSANRIEDYVAGIKTFGDLADYFTINISSPNTPGLRDLQSPKELGELLQSVMQARNEISGQDPNKPPVLVKLSPDIEYADLEPIVEQIISNSTDGIIVSNTTVRRNDLKSSHLGNETGGLSGSPLFAPSTRMLARIYTLTGGNIPLIGVGGIDSGKKAIAKINAGASLIQLYTGLVYKGPKLINNIKQAILTHITEHGFGNVSEAVGTRAREWEGK